MSKIKQFELPILELQDRELAQAMQAIVNTIFLYRVTASDIKLVDCTCPSIDVTYVKMANERDQLSKLHDAIDSEMSQYCRSFSRKPGKGRIELKFYYERKRMFVTDKTTWETWNIPFEIFPDSRWKSYDAYRAQLGTHLSSILSKVSEMALEGTEHLSDLPSASAVTLHAPNIAEQPYLYEFGFPQGQEVVRNWDVLKRLVKVVI
eukprot:TRINITY_DN8050_c0_g1_i1.p1 TRINITY_DN8050_c0_g1~~TRINITY_DN8050_c0_g1_i1.p1  ORF type:complete len:206 (+),score=38.39 TRINITY_DN8050_c0_g1_i1:104-721(+)